MYFTILANLFIWYGGGGNAAMLVCVRNKIYKDKLQSHFIKCPHLRQQIHSFSLSGLHKKIVFSVMQLYMYVMALDNP